MAIASSVLQAIKIVAKHADLVGISMHFDKDQSLKNKIDKVIQGLLKVTTSTDQKKYIPNVE